MKFNVLRNITNDIKITTYKNIFNQIYDHSSVKQVKKSVRGKIANEHLFALKKNYIKIAKLKPNVLIISLFLRRLTYF